MSWNQLRSIAQEARDAAASGRAIEALVCPNDGELLTQGPNGDWLCRFDGYRPWSDPARQAP